MLNRDIAYKYNFCNKYGCIILNYISVCEYVEVIQALWNEYKKNMRIWLNNYSQNVQIYYKMTIIIKIIMNQII